MHYEISRVVSGVRSAGPWLNSLSSIVVSPEKVQRPAALPRDQIAMASSDQIAQAKPSQLADP
jgi:hypothetical protein